MDFIEREKLRIEEEQKKKDAEKKAKEDIVKRKELELQNKRDSIYKKVGPFMEQLLKKTIEKQQQAEAENLPDLVSSICGGAFSKNFSEWLWEIDWDYYNNTSPRFWGHFKTVEGCLKNRDGVENIRDGRRENTIFNSEGKASSLFIGKEMERTDDWSIYIKCLIDIHKMILTITAKAEHNFYQLAYDGKHNVEDNDALQAPYLIKKDIIVPITNEAALIDKIADILIEIRYTWKCQLVEQILGKMRYKEISNSIIKLESSLKLHDNIINEKNSKLETIKQKKGKQNINDTWSLIIGITSGIIFLIWIMHDKAGFFSIIGNLILGGFLSFIVFGIIYGITHGIFNFLKYGYSEKDGKKDSLEIKNYETKINHTNSEISDLLKSLRATIDNDNIEEFVGDEIVLEFPLTDELADSEHYTKKDLTSKIESMIRRSKYEEKTG